MQVSQIAFVVAAGLALATIVLGGIGLRINYKSAWAGPLAFLIILCMGGAVVAVIVGAMSTQQTTP